MVYYSGGRNHRAVERTTLTRGTSNWTLGYDAASRRTSLVHPNTVTTTYGYDVVSRLTSAITKKGNQNRTQSTYTYDVVGNRLTKGGDFNESYTYDQIGNLKTKNGVALTYPVAGSTQPGRTR